MYPISGVLARLTGLSDEVVTGAEKRLTKNGAAFVALIDARELDRCHAHEAEHASLLLFTLKHQRSLAFPDPLDRKG